MLSTRRLILIYYDRFQKSHFKHTFYIKSNSNSDLIVVCLYVNDLIFIGNYQQKFEDFRETMKQQFEMTNLGLISYFLGIEVLKTNDGIFITKKYALDILKQFRMKSSSTICTFITDRLE